MTRAEKGETKGILKKTGKKRDVSEVTWPILFIDLPSVLGACKHGGRANSGQDAKVGCGTSSMMSSLVTVGHSWVICGTV